MDYAAQGIRHLTRIQLLDRTSRAEVARLDGAREFRIDHNLHSSPRGGGSITVDLAHPVNWRQVIVRLWVVLRWRGEQEAHPLLTGLPAVTGLERGPGRATAAVVVKDLTVLLDDMLGTTWVYPAGTVVTTAIRQVFTLIGITDLLITDSTATLRSHVTWEPTDTYWRVLTDLAEAIGYAAPWTTTRGVFVVQPYVLPANRPEMFRLEPGPRAIHTATVGAEVEQDVPNHFVITSRGDGESAALVAEGWNDDPANDFSIVNSRTIPYTAEVEAADQTALDAHLARVMAEYRSAAPKYSVSWRWKPVSPARQIELADAGRLRSPALTGAAGDIAAAIDAKVTVESMSWSWQDGNPMSHVASVLREVPDGG